MPDRTLDDYKKALDQSLLFFDSEQGELVLDLVQDALATPRPQDTKQIELLKQKVRVLQDENLQMALDLCTPD